MSRQIRHHIFLSYSRKDTDIMRHVRESLVQEGLTVWSDENTDMQPGTPDFTRVIEAALNEAGCLVVLFSPDSRDSRWVREEMSYAATHNLRIYGVLIRGTERESVPFGYTLNQRVDLTVNYDQGLEKLSESVGTFLNVETMTMRVQKKAQVQVNELERQQKLLDEEKRRVEAKARELAAKEAHMARRANWSERVAPVREFLEFARLALTLSGHYNSYTEQNRDKAGKYITWISAVLFWIPYWMLTAALLNWDYVADDRVRLLMLSVGLVGVGLTVAFGNTQDGLERGIVVILVTGLLATIYFGVVEDVDTMLSHRSGSDLAGTLLVGTAGYIIWFVMGFILSSFRWQAVDYTKSVKVRKATWFQSAKYENRRGSRTVFAASDYIGIASLGFPLIALMGSLFKHYINGAFSAFYVGLGLAIAVLIIDIIIAVLVAMVISALSSNENTSTRRPSPLARLLALVLFYGSYGVLAYYTFLA